MRRPAPIDDRTADRLLSGAITPDDTPPELAGVAELLRTAGADRGTVDMGRATATVAAMAAAGLALPPSATCRTVVHPGEGTPPADPGSQGQANKPANTGPSDNANKPSTPAGPPASTPASDHSNGKGSSSTTDHGRP